MTQNKEDVTDHLKLWSQMIDIFLNTEYPY